METVDRNVHMEKTKKIYFYMTASIYIVIRYIPLYGFNDYSDH